MVSLTRSPPGVGLAFDRHVEIDRAHDAVAKSILDQFLPGRAVDLHQLVKPVDQRVGRHRGRQRAAIGDLLKQGLLVGVEIEQFRRTLDLFGAQFHLAQKCRSQIDRRAAADLGSDRLPSEALGALGGEDLASQLVTGHQPLLRSAASSHARNARANCAARRGRSAARDFLCGYPGESVRHYGRPYH